MALRKGSFDTAIYPEPGKRKARRSPVQGFVDGIYGMHGSRDMGWAVTHIPTGMAIMRPSTRTAAERAVRLLAKHGGSFGTGWAFGKGNAKDADFDKLRRLVSMLQQGVEVKSKDWPHVRDRIEGFIREDKAKGLLGAALDPGRGKHWCEQKGIPKSQCAPGSYRWTQRHKGTRVMVCCPKGKWDRRTQRCRVGTRAHIIRKAVPHGTRCARGFHARK